MTSSESPVWLSTSKARHAAKSSKPQPHCPSSSPLYSVGLGCGPCDYVLGRASPETCSTGFVPVSGQTSASSMSSPGSPFSAGSLTSPVPPEVENKKGRGDKEGESHEDPVGWKARRENGTKGRSHEAPGRHLGQNGLDHHWVIFC